MSNKPQPTNDQALVLKYRALLEVSESLASHYDLAELFRHLSKQLRLAVDFEAVIITLYDPQTQMMRRYLLESEIAELADLTPDVAVDNSLAGLVWQSQKPYVLNQAQDAAAYPALMKTLQNNDIRSACILPLTSSGHRLGTIGFGSRRVGAYNEELVEFLQPLANQVAAIFLALAFQFKHAIKPFIVFAAIPYGIVGALGVLWIMGAPFGFMAFLGIISLIGVIVSHIIVLFDFIEEKHAEGEPLVEALLDAGIMRLRPVLITVGATVIALFPLAAHGGPLWEPLCYAQIGGLCAATVVTLLMVPVIYSIFVLDLKLVKWESANEVTDHKVSDGEAVPITN